MKTNNIIFTLDSYKQLHDVMYPDGTERVYSYVEARKGAEYDYSVFFGLQYAIKVWLEGVVITKQLIDEAEPILKAHFKYSGDVWNRAKWDYIVEQHGGLLPVRIKAVPEGSKVPVDNIIMSIENTDPKCFWLTNALETLLQAYVWYATTVCTRSHSITETIRRFFQRTAEEGSLWLADFYLHDFAQRGTSCMEQAGLGGMAHLVNSRGTDTDMALPFAIEYYNANIEDLAFSVPASEHSIATALGPDKEFDVTRRLIQKFPNGILSVVSDSYDISSAVLTYCTTLKQDILARNGKFVIRPDSPRFEGDTPAAQVLWIAEELWNGFGGRGNSKGYRVLDSHVGIIYGDSLTETQIEEILSLLEKHKFSAETCVFGCGGYLLQKVNRDTQRFAFKSSAQCRDGVWFDVFKQPKDASKASKRGKLKLVRQMTPEGSTFVTAPESDPRPDVMELVFENGVLLRNQDFDDVRKNARKT